MNVSFPVLQLNSGSPVSVTIDGKDHAGTLESVAYTLKRGTTDVESVDALVFVPGVGRKAFDVREIGMIPVSGGAVKLGGGS